MGVPGLSAYLDPVLAAVGDGEPHRSADLKQETADRLRLSAQDLAELLPSGKRKHSNRTEWAVTYLFQAGLVERLERGVVRILPRGRAVLESTNRPLTLSMLDQFAEFREFKERGKATAEQSQRGSKQQR
jgi:restriction system protein